MKQKRDGFGDTYISFDNIFDLKNFLYQSGWKKVKEFEDEFKIKIHYLVNKFFLIVHDQLFIFNNENNYETFNKKG